MTTLVKHNDLVAMGSYLTYAREKIKDEVYWVWLHELPEVSIIHKKRLLKTFGTPRAIFEASDKDLREALSLPRDTTLPNALRTTKDFNPHIAPSSYTSPRTKQVSHVEELLRSHRRLGIKVLTYQSPLYRLAIKEDVQAPLLYYYRGQLQSPDAPIVGIVSSSLTYNDENCRDVCHHYNERGFTFATGVSFGTSIETLFQIVSEESVVYAFAGGGLDRCYPLEAWPVLEKVMRKGAVISEYSLGKSPTVCRAIKRNRSIALWSNEIISLTENQPNISRWVVHAAHEYKRLVYTVVEQGQNSSIVGTKERKPLQLRRVFSHYPKIGTSSPIGSDNERICSFIADLLQCVPMPTEELATALQLKKSRLLSLLIDMELNGTISYHRGGKWHYRV